jgi:hypothetical protein
MSPSENGETEPLTIANHLVNLKNLTQEARQHPDRLERILGDNDHATSAIAAIAALAP